MAADGGSELAVAGGDDEAERMRRAVESYASSRHVGVPALWPAGGIKSFLPLLDEVLGDNHLVKVRMGRGARSARHTHDSDQVIVVTGGHGTLETDDGSIALSPGKVVLTEKGVPHVHATDADEVEYVYFTRTGHDTVVLGPRDHA